jgi:hypothetical protein
MHVYEVRPRKDRRAFDLMSDVLPFGRQVCQFLQSKSQVKQSGHSLAVSNYLGKRIERETQRVNNTQRHGATTPKRLCSPVGLAPTEEGPHRQSLP